MLRVFFCMLFILTAPLYLQAQTGAGWPVPSPQSRAYSAFRTKITRPPYGLAKVMALIAKQKTDEEGMTVLAPQTLAALSLREQFTYHMIHGEADNQNCDAMPPIIDEQLKIFGQLPSFFDEVGWSERQQQFFINNRDSVLALIRESTLRSGHMGINYKQAVVDVKGTEMIPVIVEQIRREPKDHDLLTVLMLLMKDAAYPPFMASVSYKKLYGDNSDYRAYLTYSKANEELIISRATAFYQQRKG